MGRRRSLLLVAWLGLAPVGVACSDDGEAAATDPSAEAGAPDGVARDDDAQDTTPRVRYVGRVDWSDDDGPRLAWPGTRVVVRFRGPALRVTLRERNIDVGPSEYDVLVDGAIEDEPFVPDDGEGDYALAEGLDPEAPHVVELYRRTEAMVGITQVLGFDLPDGELLAPPPSPGRRVEFLGDSESTGYGIDCADRAEAFSGATENERKAFPSLVSRELDAESHNVSFSGKGVLQNDDATDVVFADLYPRSIPLTDDASPWDFTTWQPDVVWIGLGANDFSLGPDGDRGPPDLDAFEDRYRELVALVRDENPSARIVCAVEGIVNDDYPPGFEAYSNLKARITAVVEARHAGGDAEVYVHELPRSKESVDLTGCASHPNAAYHQKAAASVAAKIRAITGWP